MTVLVTGATGTNGLEVVKQTLARGGRVRAFVRDKATAGAVLPAEVELFEGDLADRAAAHHPELRFLLSRRVWKHGPGRSCLARHAPGTVSRGSSFPEHQPPLGEGGAPT
jgi:hypothetical protein